MTIQITRKALDKLSFHPVGDDAILVMCDNLEHFAIFDVAADRGDEVTFFTAYGARCRFILNQEDARLISESYQNEMAARNRNKGE